MKQSAIHKSRNVAATWRAVLRLVWLVSSAAGGALLAIQQSGLAKPSAVWIWLAVGATAASVVLEATFGAPWSSRSAPFGSGDRQKFMSACAVEIQQQSGVSVEYLGISLWVIHTPRRSLRACLRREKPVQYLYRIERFRASEPDPVDGTWMVGRGVIGECLGSGDPVYRDYRPLQAQHPVGSGAPSASQWKVICKKRLDYGFRSAEFVSMINRYEQVYAHPIKNEVGKLVGCISLDATRAPQGTVHLALNSQPAVSLIHRLAQTMRTTVEREAVRP